MLTETAITANSLELFKLLVYLSTLLLFFHCTREIRHS